MVDYDVLAARFESGYSAIFLPEVKQLLKAQNKALKRIRDLPAPVHLPDPFGNWRQYHLDVQALVNSVIGPDLKPCPFCSSEQLEKKEYGNPKMLHVRCKNCGAESPLQMWNQRG